MFEGIINKFSSQHLLVVGDIILDEYVFGAVERINPEAPVPILDVSNVEQRLGGAANVAHNAAKLGAKVTLIGQVGKDENKNLLTKLLDEAGIHYFLIERDDNPTIKKTRIMAENQQVIRVDHESKQPLQETHLQEISAYLHDCDYNVAIISDYAKGFITPELVSLITKKDVPVLADPKPENIHHFKDVTLISPNQKEAFAITGESRVANAGKKLVEQLNTNVVITRGKDGASLFTKDGQVQYLPARAKDVFDVSGAGDTFITTLTLTFATGADLYESVALANHASAIAVGKVGTATITPKELAKSQTHKKILSLSELQEVRSQLKEEGKKVVFTNGCFDILHVGHLKLLNEAKSFGDHLILGLNTDASVQRYKGPTRPINKQDDRAEVLANLNMIDNVVFFDEDDPCQIISELKPDIHVKGGDYDPNDYETMPEAKVVKDYGGEVKIINLVAGKSTTNIIEKSQKD